MKGMLCTILTTSSVIAAQAALFEYTVTLSGPSESPPNISPGTGNGTVIYDDANHTLGVQLSFSGLTAGTTASHIHAPTSSPLTGTAGVATTTPTFQDFPLGVTSGTYSRTLDLTSASSYNPSFITANGGTTGSAETALAAAIAGGDAYWNVHTTAFPGGEIRGFLVPIPEPSALALTSVAGLGWALREWRRKGSYVRR